MRFSAYYYWGLGVFSVLFLIFWFVGLQTLSEYLWRLLHALSPR